MKKSRFLIMARVGDTSLHEQWLRGTKRNFDLYLSYYGDKPGRYKEDADYYREKKSTKWPALHEHIVADREIVESYDAVWFPDDDLLIGSESISRMFDLFSAFDLALAQPALTLNSYFSHSTVLVNSSYVLRFTNFVEVMGPVFSQKALKLLEPTFSKVTVGWGLDLLWPYLLEQESAQYKMGIIDDTPMTHTRPVGGGDIYKGNFLKLGLEDIKKLSVLYPEADLDLLKLHAKFCIKGGIKNENYGTGLMAKLRGRLHRRQAKYLAEKTIKYKSGE